MSRSLEKISACGGVCTFKWKYSVELLGKRMHEYLLVSCASTFKMVNACCSRSTTMREPPAVTTLLDAINCVLLYQRITFVAGKRTWKNGLVLPVFKVNFENMKNKKKSFGSE